MWYLPATYQGLLVKSTCSENTAERERRNFTFFTPAYHHFTKCSVRGFVAGFLLVFFFFGVCLILSSSLNALNVAACVNGKRENFPSTMDQKALEANGKGGNRANSRWGTASAWVATRHFLMQWAISHIADKTTLFAQHFSPTKIFRRP